MDNSENSKKVHEGDFSRNRTSNDRGGMMKILFAVFVMTFNFLSMYGQNIDWIIDERDGQKYKIVQIGNQWWTAENMNFNVPGGSWYYDNDSLKYKYLGRLYTFEAAKESCPCGWHLPTDEEWKTLEMQIGLTKEQADGYNLRGTNQGGKLKSTGFDYWNSPNMDATNSTGFLALGGGYRDPNGGFNRIGKGISYWTSTDGKQDMAWFRSLHNDRGDIHRGFYKKSFAYHVRCIKNSSEGFDYNNQDKYSGLTYTDLLMAYKSEMVRSVKPAGVDSHIPAHKENISLVKYKSGDLELNALLYKPENNTGVKYPALVYFHGGYSLDARAFSICKPFIDKGFVVLFPMLRGENGNPGNFEVWYGEVADAKNAINWMANQEYIDLERIYAFGHSSGGGVSSLLSLHDDIPVKYTASCGGLYREQTLIRMSDRPGIPFNAEIKEERRLRLLIGNLKYMKKQHFAFHGDTDMLEAVKIANSEIESLVDCKLKIIKVKGGHFESVFPAIDEYLKIILNDNN